MIDPRALTPFETLALPRTYLTSGVPGIGGEIKQRDEEFLVEEIPAYPPSGEGEHLALWVEKRGLSTTGMTRVLARHFGVPPRAVGVAGMKDKRAITRQMVTVHTPGKTPEDFPPLEHDSISIHWVDLHKNKLKRGHLKGNRFIVRVRGVQPTAVLHARRVLDHLERTGVPNRFGPQRFGYLERNHLIGRALLTRDHRRVCELLLSPDEVLTGDAARVRGLFVQGAYAEAAEIRCAGGATEQRVLERLAAGDPPERAVRAIRPSEASYYVTAFQSAIFNNVLEQRLGARQLDTLIPGDLAFRHDNGAVFPIEEGSGTSSPDDPDIRSRLAWLEISPSGPMWGPEMTRAGGQTGEIEDRALHESGAGVEDIAGFVRRTRADVQGARRPLRVPITVVDVEGGVDEHGGYVKCAFELPRGSFATVAMEEVMKSGKTQGRGD